jgi:hypothetical protein
MIAAEPHAPRPRRWGRILLAQVIVVIGGLTALEILARGYFWIQHDPYDAERTRAEVRHLVDLNRSFVPGPPGTVPEPAQGDIHTHMTLHPYLGFEMDSGCSFVDDEYQRLKSGADAGAFQIVLVGGSVSALFGMDEWKTHGLVQRLTADPRLAGRTVRIQNFARGAYKEPQQLNFVVYLLCLGFKPDVVIDISGFNEVAMASANQVLGWHPVFPSAVQWAHMATSGVNNREAIDMVSRIRRAQHSLEEWGDRIADWGLTRFCILGKPALHRMYALRHVIVDESRAYTEYLVDHKDDMRARGPALPSSPLEAVRESVECWKQSSRSLADLCRARGILFLEFLQPTLSDAGSKPLTDHELETGNCDSSWVTGVMLGYPLLRAAGSELRSEGVDFIDASLIFKGRHDDMYYDCCHFGHAGNERLAEEIARELLARLPADKTRGR